MRRPFQPVLLAATAIFFVACGGLAEYPNLPNEATIADGQTSTDAREERAEGLEGGDEDAIAVGDQEEGGADAEVGSIDADTVDASTDSNTEASVGPADAGLGTTDSHAPEVLTDMNGTWHLVWADEFDGPAVDPANWTIIDTQDVKREINNKELEVYKPANVSIADGALVIEAREEPLMGQQYTSGKVTTRNLQSFMYGKFIARIKLPATPAMWPAFWSMGITGGWPACGEMDILEAKGRVPAETSGALHWGNGSMYTQINTFPAGTDLSDWHEYVAEWTATGIALSVDGRPFFSMNTQPTNSFNQPFYFILNLAVGGTFDNGVSPPPNMGPQRMYVDYVRVYQR
jgi:beta-glucanase (GH16 family)